MDNDTSCGMKNILRRMFRRKTHHTESRQVNGERSDAQRTEDRMPTVRITRIRGTFDHLPRQRSQADLRHLARENSLAPYLGYPYGEVVIMNSSRVAIMTGSQLRELLRENPRVSCIETASFDPFTEASASCPIAEESFDSGLLKMTSPWFI